MMFTEAKIALLNSLILPPKSLPRVHSPLISSSRKGGIPRLYSGEVHPRDRAVEVQSVDVCHARDVV